MNILYFTILCIVKVNFGKEKEGRERGGAKKGRNEIGNRFTGMLEKWLKYLKKIASQIPSYYNISSARMFGFSLLLYLQEKNVLLHKKNI